MIAISLSIYVHFFSIKVMAIFSKPQCLKATPVIFNHLTALLVTCYLLLVGVVSPQSSDKRRHSCLSFVFFVHVFPAVTSISSLHLLSGLPLFLLPSLGCHSVHLFVHLLSCILPRCPAHLHFCLPMCLRTSLKFVFFLMFIYCPCFASVCCSWYYALVKNLSF